MTEFRLSAVSGASPQAPAVDQPCGRVTVVLGANGTGKTQLLYRILNAARNVGKDKSVLLVDSVRAFHEKLISVSLGSEAASFWNKPHILEESYRGLRSSVIYTRIQQALRWLQHKSEVQKREYYDRLANWAREGRNGAPPEQPLTAIERVFALFTEIFPDISLSVTESEQIYCQKKGQTYPITGASDGEKQVFALLCDLLLNDGDELLVLVDEPEAHLNPYLAVRFWNILESHLIRSQFVHVSHCISFAMREQVDSLFVIDGPTGALKPLPSIADLSQVDATEFLGAIPGILSRPFALAVEGNNDSFDSAFYAWLINRSDVSVVALGSCTDVEAATRRLSLWRELAPTARIVGIIDRDFSYNEPSACEDEGVIVLHYHEAESYLCHPDVIASLVEKLFGRDPVETRKQVVDSLVKRAATQSLQIAALRAFPKLQIDFSISLPKSALTKVRSLDDLTDGLVRMAESRSSVIKERLSSVTIKASLQRELGVVQRAINERDVDALLAIVPGKETLKDILELLGLASETELIDACKKHLSVSDFPCLQSLSQKIIARLR
jgi:hypothetical protein